MSKAPIVGIALGTVLAVVPAGRLGGQEGDSVARPEPDPLAACPPSPDGALSVSLHGTVRDEESEVPLPAARVRVEYEPRAGEAPPARETSADREGRYLLCNLRAFAAARITVGYRGEESAPRRHELARSERLDLSIDLGRPAFLVFTVVDSETGRPIRGASLALRPVPLSGVTDSLGRAGFRRVPPGPYRLHVRSLGYAERSDSISVGDEQLAEMRVELVPRAIAVEPLEVRVTGRDPYLLERGFYERRERIDDGWFATKPDLEPYLMFRNLFRFKRELTVRYARNQVIFIDGRPMERLGFESVRELNEYPFRRVRGIEAYHCSDAPPGLLTRFTTAIERPMGDCHVVLIWTR